MKIVKADTSHIDYLSESLVEYFEKANKYFGFPKYNDDFDIMREHVSKRINSKAGNFYYLVAQDEGLVGFVNLMIDENSIGSILAVSGDTKESVNGLLNKAMEFFKENNISQIQVEAFAYEEELLELLESMKARKNLINYTIDNF